MVVVEHGLHVHDEVGIRADLAPSAAILGVDPSYLAPLPEAAASLDVDPQTTDVCPLPDGRLLVLEVGAPTRFVSADGP